MDSGEDVPQRWRCGGTELRLQYWLETLRMNAQQAAFRVSRSTRGRQLALYGH